MKNGRTAHARATSRGSGKRNVFARIFSFYYTGFRTMSRTWKIVWLVVIIKLFIMFAVLRVFFFPNYLGTRCDSNEARSEYVLRELTRKND